MKQYEHKLVRVKELGAIIGVCQSTIWRWVKLGKLPQPIRPTKRTSLFDVAKCMEALSAMDSGT